MSCDATRFEGAPGGQAGALGRQGGGFHGSILPHPRHRFGARIEVRPALCVRYNGRVSGVRTRRVTLLVRRNPMDTFTFAAGLCSILSLLVGLLDLLIGMRRTREKARKRRRE